TPIRLESAIDSALKNNLNIKQATLVAEYQRALIKSANNIPQTAVTTEIGQLNSVYQDNRWGVSQSFNFPTVYVNQKKLFNAEWEKSVFAIALKEADVKKIVRKTFYKYLYLKEKQHLLQLNDSMYNLFLQRANFRFSKGESNILEKVTAETQRGNISIQLRELEKELEVVKLEFNLLLNTFNRFVPGNEKIKIDMKLIWDSGLVEQHSGLKIIEQQKKIAEINRKLERSKLFPDLNMGYFSGTMRGTGADNEFYTASTRFQAVQIGIGIPLFFGAQKARIKASYLELDISETNYLLEKKRLQSEYFSELNQYQANISTVNYFEAVALKNSKIIFETSDSQFKNGEINYLEWVMLTNQAISIQSNYLDAIKNLNETIIQLNYLTSK
ncbi:MAG TPA: TolC family protein, partial [Bacteroidia bacterium]|nr:TolC family protein [Bacteroidia bacterium]